ncbi:MAG: DUF3131 domain-containing protein [Infirmifilum sp.]
MEKNAKRGLKAAGEKGRMLRQLIAICFLIMLLLPAAILSPPETPDKAVAEPVVDWLSIAKAAWNYFQPYYGLSSRGVNYATPSWHYVTDWDLGCYISAIIDAEDIGILPRDGFLGADDRIRRVLNFLAARPLHPSGVPYWGYNSDTFEPYNAAPSTPSDAGRLLIALYRLKQHRPDLAAQIDYVVERNGFSRFATSVPANGFYAYYYAHGYHLWGYDTPQVLAALSLPRQFGAMKKINAYGVELPYTEVTMEPILLAAFELNPPPEFFEWAQRAYKAQENRYLATGKPTAFTEGALKVAPNYIYEWIVDIYSGDTFTVWSPPLGKLSRVPIVFAKAALGMHAIWNTNYTAFLAKYVLKAETPNGFYEGVDENGNIEYFVTDKTNAMIVNAARYAIKKQGPVTIKADSSAAFYPGDQAMLNITLLHTLPLPTTLYLQTPPGITAGITPPRGTTNFTATLKLTPSENLKPGIYTLTITASTMIGNYTTTIPLRVVPPGYTLTIKALDASGRPVPNATVQADNITATTDKNGTTTIKHLNGTTTLKISYKGLTLWGPVKLDLHSDTHITANLSLYEVHVLAVTPDGKPAPGVLLVAKANNTEIASPTTNTTGYATLPRLPRGNVTIYAYTPDRNIQLAEWHVQITGDGEIIDPPLNPPTNPTLPTATAILAAALAILEASRRKARARPQACKRKT